MSYDISRALKVLKSVEPDGTLSFNVLVEAFQDARAEEREQCARECADAGDEMGARRLRDTADAIERGRAEAMKPAPTKRRRSPHKSQAGSK